MRRVRSYPVPMPFDKIRARNLRTMRRTLKREASKAGVGISKKSLEDMTAEDLLRICALNNIEVKFRYMNMKERQHGRSSRRYK